MGLALSMVVSASLVSALSPHVDAAGERLLFVAGGVSLPRSDRALVDLFRAAGFDVTVADDDTVGTSSAVGYDVVVISSTVVPATVGSALTAADVGVVSTEAYLFDDLGMTRAVSSDRGERSSTTVDMVDVDHEISGGLTGNVAVVTGGSLTFGRPASTASVIAKIPGSQDAALFAYESEASMVGLAAPARRVGLFLTFDNADDLTPDGKDLVARAVRWAASAEPPDTGSTTTTAASTTAASTTTTDASATTTVPPGGGPVSVALTALTPSVTVTPGDRRLSFVWFHPDASQYQLRTRITGSSGWKWKSPTASTSAALTALAAGTSYDVEVRALIASTWRPWVTLRVSTSGTATTTTTTTTRPPPHHDDGCADRWGSGVGGTHGVDASGHRHAGRPAVEFRLVPSRCEQVPTSDPRHRQHRVELEESDRWYHRNAHRSGHRHVV